MKYIVWFSWGTDSTFVAWFLKKQGHEVLLVNLKNTVEKNKCCEVPTKLFEIANSLDLPLKIVDVTKDFKKIVIDNFIDAYLKWKTPNPCINCNELVRFQMLDKIRQKYWYDYVSTWHYVKRIDVNWFYTFSVPKDKTKDQTYMLYRVLKYQNIVKYLDFPISDYLKEDVKKIILDQKLPIDTQKESQNICFVPNDDYVNYIKTHSNIKMKKWFIVDLNWNKLWEHTWVINYTIWQRKWLNLNINQRKYVVKLDYKNNIVVVWDHEDLFTNKVCVDNLFYSENYEWKIYWKIRYKTNLVEVEKIEWNCVFLKDKVRAVASWQHLVFYGIENWKNFVLWWWQII